ncbi:MAG: hypothetical protein ACOX8S_06400 [Christensenellales bacterium]|jgi:hypothetical protein
MSIGGREQSMDIIRKDSHMYHLSKFRTLMFENEQQLDILLESPDKSLIVEDDRGYSMEQKKFRDNVKGSTEDTLRARIESAKEANVGILQLTYDFFFGGRTRTLYPDSEKTVQAYKAVYDLAKEYGLEFSASVTNPLDLGGGYVKKHDEVGYSWHYHEGLIDDSGCYSVNMSRQTQWSNNKGPVRLEIDRIVVYAFREERYRDTSYFYVNPDEILDISDTARLEEMGSEEISKRGNGSLPVRIIGNWQGKKPGYDRCLTVLVYKTQELDYFCDGALGYMKGVIDQHGDAGITYQGFYSDEMHIQFDWDSNVHFGLNEVTTRYMTKNFARRYAAAYGKEFEDFGKYLVYFSYHQHGFKPEEENLPAQHIMSPGPEGIYRTWLFRKRYFEMLNDVVVGLCADTKAYAEEKFQNPIAAQGHATWKESPTLDKNYPEMKWYSLRRDDLFSRYDYHPEYVFSSSIIEAVAGCYDYFRWNDYYTGGGTDHGEHGYSDRNYYNQAFGASLAALNKEKRGYAGGWGSPQEVLDRLNAMGRVFGNGTFRGPSRDQIVQNMQSRLTDVLAVYPLDLLYTEERFGSWMVQYGYCNYITERKLLEHSHVDEDGAIIVNGRPYRALVFLYQSFVSNETLALLESFLKKGGKVLWMAAPPALDWNSGKRVQGWQDLFGVRATEALYRGMQAGGKCVRFDDAIGTADMKIPTDMLPDYVYSFEADGSKEIAWLGKKAVGFEKEYDGGGRAVYAAFRVRDDQSGSMGADISTLFDLLCYMGAYDEKGGEIISRPQGNRYMIQRFPNGAVSMANHYRKFYEKWASLYGRNPESDAQALKGRELPTMEINLDGESVLGHVISYKGSGSLTFWHDKGKLLGYCGNGRKLIVDGRDYVFADEDGEICYAHIAAEHLNAKEAIALFCDRPGRVTIPNETNIAQPKAVACKKNMLAAEREIDVSLCESGISVNFDEAMAGNWVIIYRE